MRVTVPLHVQVPDGTIQDKKRCCNSIENVTSIVDAAIKYFPQDGIFQVGVCVCVCVWGVVVL